MKQSFALIPTPHLAREEMPGVEGKAEVKARKEVKRNVSAETNRVLGDILPPLQGGRFLYFADQGYRCAQPRATVRHPSWMHCGAKKEGIKIGGGHVEIECRQRPEENSGNSGRERKG